MFSHGPAILSDLLRELLRRWRLELLAHVITVDDDPPVANDLMTEPAELVSVPETFATGAPPHSEALLSRIQQSGREKRAFQHLGERALLSASERRSRAHECLSIRLGQLPRADDNEVDVTIAGSKIVKGRRTMYDHRGQAAPEALQ
jgi:hypothetical protein